MCFNSFTDCKIDSQLRSSNFSPKHWGYIKTYSFTDSCKLSILIGKNPFSSIATFDMFCIGFL